MPNKAEKAIGFIDPDHLHQTFRKSAVCSHKCSWKSGKSQGEKGAFPHVTEFKYPFGVLVIRNGKYFWIQNCET